MKNEIDAELRRIKFEVDLVKQAACMGYVVDKSKGVRGAWLAMKKGSDSILVLREPNRNGFYYKNTVDDSDKGTIVDFMLRRGYGFEEIIKIRQQDKNTELKYLHKEIKVADIKDLQEANRLAMKKYEGWRYEENNYTKSRGINNEIAKQMDIATNEKGALFSLKINNDICSTIEYNTNGKYFQKGLPRGICTMGEKDKPKNIVITESPIDALSYEQMRKEKQQSACDTLYIATCGSLASEVNKEILRIAKEHEDASVVLAFDNDEAGKRMSENVDKMLGCRKCIVHKPAVGKDFNEMLNILLLKNSIAH